ncbi:uncharacterized protein BHQ10_004342 [Talaromyces amestolkiae]|uniref:Uncharacterized protein n=1 Tax=Talaromyces amestolkiae TaxID=1196081 RepID=A0A364KXP7_TALAM|nr:uncharacterized protein BHQ10_004342 [Talaromyces amestolkiae]RAO68330.1 hypothetical protein BHQ10_004342 [Talaromyces amestolkiae]
MASSKITPTRATRKLLSFRILFLLFLVGIDYLPSRRYIPSNIVLSSRSPLGIGVLADVVLMSTFVEVTETVLPPPAATAAPASAPDGNAPTYQATDGVTNTALAASVTASGLDSSQLTGSGGGQAMAQIPGTTIPTPTAAATAARTATTTDSREGQVSGLVGTKTALVSIPGAPSGISTSTTRGKSSPTAVSTPSATSILASASSIHNFPTYAAGLASGTAIIAAAGLFTAVYLVKRRRRQHGQLRKPGPVTEIGQVNSRPFSIRKISEVMSVTNLNHKPCGVGGGSNKLTSMDPPPDIDPETSWPRGHVPPDPEELREMMDDEKRRSGGRNGFDSAVDLGIGYVSSAAATPSDKREGYFDGYSSYITIRPLSTMSMPDHMKPIMTPLQPRHTQDSVPDSINRLDTISPSIYSRRDSILTSFGEIHAKIEGNNNFNLQREEYCRRKEQARRHFGDHSFVEEESCDDWSEPNRGLEASGRPAAATVEEYSSPYTAHLSTTSPKTEEGIGHDDYFSIQHSAVNQNAEGQIQNDYFSARHSILANSINRESQYEDIDLSQNDPYVEEASKGDKRTSGGYFGRFFR